MVHLSSEERKWSKYVPASNFQISNSQNHRMFEPNSCIKNNYILLRYYCNTNTTTSKKKQNKTQHQTSQIKITKPPTESHKVKFQLSNLWCMQDYPNLNLPGWY